MGKQSNKEMSGQADGQGNAWASRQIRKKVGKQTNRKIGGQADKQRNRWEIRQAKK